MPHDQDNLCIVKIIKKYHCNLCYKNNGSLVLPQWWQQQQVSVQGLYLAYLWKLRNFVIEIQ